MIYIHVPFCKSFCTYCDFYSEARCEGFGAYEQSLLCEIEERRAEIAQTAQTNTLYIGGGTPSVLPLSVLERLVKALPLRDFSEFTVEVNPEDIVSKGEEYVRGLLDLGVNRISMGVQSLDDGILRWMNRRHSSARAIEAVDILRGAGVKNLSLDLIFGVAGLTDEMLVGTLSAFLRLRPQHISAYQLSIEEGSALAAMVEDGRYVEPSEEECARQYGIICRMLREAGYHHYEISNWALPGYEAKHNSAYWTREPYVGLGPAAHSLAILPSGEQRRSWNSESLSGWTSSFEVLSEEEIREETIMLGLRTDAGVEVDGVHKKIGEEQMFIADSIIAELI